MDPCLSRSTSDENDMATNDDTSKLRRSRRKQLQASAAEANAAEIPVTGLPPLRSPLTLEEALGNARSLMIQLRGVLHCLSDVLQYSDDDDAAMHAEVARSTAGWAQLAAAELDPAKLRPLIDAIRRRDNETLDEPGLNSKGPYQVKESTPMYLV